MTPRALSIVGWSGSGKTTLIERLLPVLSRQGFRTGVLKHSSHAHAMDSPTTDTARLRQAGATWVGLSTASQTVVLTEGGEASTRWALETLARACDLVIVEGWKTGPLPKIEVWRSELGPPLARAFEVKAVVTSAAIDHGRVFAPDQLEEIAAFVLELVRASPPSTRT